MTIARDLRWAVRTLLRSPGFTSLTVVTLALGIGLTTAVFSLFNAVVLQSLPRVERPAELVALDEGSASYPAYLYLRQGTTSFSGVAAWANRWFALSGVGAADRIQGVVASGNYFEVLGTRPALGRFFTAREEESGEPIAVLSHATWAVRFAGSPSALGSDLVLNGVPFRIVGVAPRGFRGVGFGDAPDVWIPIGTWPRVATGSMARLDYHRRSWGWMSLFGRLRPGLDLARARAEAEAVVKREAATFPDDVNGEIHVQPLARAAAGAGQAADPARLLGLLLGAVFVVLLIACANLANLLLGRAVSRRREIAIRQALGAGRARLIRQLLTESLLLALCGGAAGLVVASWALTFLARVPVPGGGALGDSGAALDLRVFLFAGGISVATGLLFGSLPAFQGTRSDLLPALKNPSLQGGRRATARSVLVTAQVALCLVLLAGAGLLLRSLQNALATDIGFRPAAVVHGSVNLGLARYDAPRALRFTEDLAARVSAMPGVRAVSWTGSLPLSGDRDSESVRKDPAAATAHEVVDVQAVGPDYFVTVGTPILRGREFRKALDAPQGPGTVVVNEAAARRFWRGQDPLGRRMNIYGADRTVVGVSRDARFRSWSDAPAPMVFVNADQLGGEALLSSITLLVRTDGDARAALAALRGAVAGLDPNLPVFEVRPLQETISGLLMPQRFGSALLGLFGVFALVLAAVGIYAAVSYSVAQRTREVGIRMALGARASDVQRLIVRQSAAPLVAGLAAGIALAAAVTRMLGGFLYGVPPTDPVTFAAVTTLLALCGVAAAYVPARWASRIDPIAAIRNE